MSIEMLAPIDGAISELEVRHSLDEVDYEDYVVQKIILSAQRMDVAPNARSRNLRATLDLVLESPDWDKTKSLGYQSVTASPGHLRKGFERVNTYIAALQNSAGIPTIDNSFYSRMIIGNEKNDDIRFQIETLLKLFEQAGVGSSNQHEMSMVCAIMLQGLAFNFIGQTVGSLAKGTPSAVEEGNEDNFWKAKLHGVTDKKQSVPYCLGFAGRMENVAQQEAAALYGADDGQAVVQLLKALWYTTVKEIPAGTKRDKTIHAFQEIVTDVVQHNLGSAWEKLETFCRTYPDSISSKTAIRITGERRQQLFYNNAEKMANEIMQKHVDTHSERMRKIRERIRYTIEAGSEAHKPIVEQAIGRVITLQTMTGPAEFVIEAVYASNATVLNDKEGSSLHKTIAVTKVRLKRTSSHTTRTGSVIPEERVYKLAGEIVPYLT